MLWSSKPSPNIRVAPPEEFASFVDLDTSFFLNAPPRSHIPEALLRVSDDSDENDDSAKHGKKSTAVQPVTE